MKEFLSNKDTSFDMTKAREEESDSKNVKRHKMYMKNPRKGMKNHGLNKNGMFLLCSTLYYMGKEVTLVQRMFFLKERPCFLPSYLINFLLFSLKIYLGSYPKNTTACSFYNLRNMIEYKDKFQVIISLF